ncbi:cell division inhibitor SepF [Geomicrobium halophilum]|uniref:Cell division protein SepF n=1 Tax=Geomicrobium halophilum TaxID=549000 RepID=A0A841PNM0_9BACL|nr:cell division protein SepF [Geomicrobium halophilum]MBB6449374.1 cell division inhibitor SepF [Geomicrobium halophilum]
MGIKSRFKQFFDFEDDYIEEDVEVPDDVDREQSTKQGKNVVSLQSIQQSAKMIIIEPQSYDEAQDVADHLKNRRSVIINLQQIPGEQGKKVVDFLSGTVYAIEGDIQKIGLNIFLCTPENVDVSGEVSELLQHENVEW